MKTLGTAEKKLRLRPWQAQHRLAHSEKVRQACTTNTSECYRYNFTTMTEVHVHIIHFYLSILM